MKKVYISKGEWFDKGSRCELVCQYIWKYGTATNDQERKWQGPESAGIFSGMRNGQADEEGCSFDEFDILETEEQ